MGLLRVLIVDGTDAKLRVYFCYRLKVDFPKKVFSTLEILPFLCTAVHVILSFLVSFSSIFFHYLSISWLSNLPWGCNKIGVRKEWEKGRKQEIITWTAVQRNVKIWDYSTRLWTKIFKNSLCRSRDSRTFPNRHHYNCTLLHDMLFVKVGIIDDCATPETDRCAISQRNLGLCFLLRSVCSSRDPTKPNPPQYPGSKKEYNRFFLLSFISVPKLTKIGGFCPKKWTHCNSVLLAKKCTNAFFKTAQDNMVVSSFLPYWINCISRSGE